MITSIIDFQDLRSSLPKIKYQYEDMNLERNGFNIEYWINKYLSSKGFMYDLFDIYKIIDICCDMGIAKFTKSQNNQNMLYFEWI